jgi:DUF3048 family protein
MSEPEAKPEGDRQMQSEPEAKPEGDRQMQSEPEAKPEGDRQMQSEPKGTGRRPALVAAVLCLAVTAAACSSKSGSALPTVKQGATSLETVTTSAPAVAPFTGRALFNPDLASRPAVMLKVGDDAHARPQSGIDKADIVYEERVEGNTVRFLAVFQSQDATSVGPVRSVRSTDAGVIAPIGGVFAFSGGIPPFVSLVSHIAGLVPISEDNNGSAFHLRPDRQRPYKTYANTAEMRARAGSGAAAPPALFSFLPEGATSDAAGAVPASQATVGFGPGTVPRWDWDAASGKWKRSINGVPQRTDSGAQFAFTNVILQMLPYRGTPYVDRANSGVDEAVTSGSGTATLLTEGKQIPLRWLKSGDKALTTFTDTAGVSIRLPAGTTWIALVPTGTPVTITAPPPPVTTSG